jgi:FtsH-binding integral membrane protein
MARDFGLSRFIRKTYLYTGGSVAASLAAANFANVYMPGNNGLVVGGAVAGFVSLICAMYMSPTYETQKIEGINCLVAKDSVLRKGLFGVGVLGVGLSLAPLFQMANFVDPSLLSRALLATTTTFGFVSVMSLRMPKSSMLKYGSVLMSGLLALLALQLGGMFAGYMYGANQFTHMVQQVDMYGGIGLFTLLIAYDTHMAIRMYEQGTPDHIGASLQLYLDFISILRRMIQIMILRKNE